LNRLGYAYAAMGDMPRAEALMQRYIAAMPADPNPEDSYGDILFKVGRYGEARAHFESALKKDPTFGPSQHELGDVFAMLGNQAGRGRLTRNRHEWRRIRGEASNTVLRLH